MKKLILLLFFALSLLMGAQKGSVSLFVFFNGEPYQGMDVNIDGKVTYKTDAKGLVKVYLEAGRHEAKIIQDGNPLAKRAKAPRSMWKSRAVCSRRVPQTGWPNWRTFPKGTWSGR